MQFLQAGAHAVPYAARYKIKILLLLKTILLECKPCYTWKLVTIQSIKAISNIAAKASKGKAVQGAEEVDDFKPFFGKYYEEKIFAAADKRSQQEYILDDQEIEEIKSIRPYHH